LLLSEAPKGTIAFVTSRFSLFSLSFLLKSTLRKKLGVLPRNERTPLFSLVSFSDRDGRRARWLPWCVERASEREREREREREGKREGEREKQCSKTCARSEERTNFVAVLAGESNVDGRNDRLSAVFAPDPGTLLLG
jgi:hypothetical protein